MIRFAITAALVVVCGAACAPAAPSPMQKQMTDQYADQDRFVELFHQSPLRTPGLPPAVGDATATMDGYAYCKALADGTNDIDATYSLMHDKGLGREDAQAVAVSARSTLCKYS
jgi:hypothetical protein